MVHGLQWLHIAYVGDNTVITQECKIVIDWKSIGTRAEIKLDI